MPNMLFKVDTMVKPTEVQPVVTRTPALGRGGGSEGKYGCL